MTTEESLESIADSLRNISDTLEGIRSNTYSGYYEDFFKQGFELMMEILEGSISIPTYQTKFERYKTK